MAANSFSKQYRLNKAQSKVVHRALKKSAGISRKPASTLVSLSDLASRLAK